MSGTLASLAENAIDIYKILEPDEEIHCEMSDDGYEVIFHYSKGIKKKRRATTSKSAWMINGCNENYYNHIVNELREEIKNDK